MAFRRIGRDDDHPYPPPWVTPSKTDDENDYPESSFVISESSVTSSTYFVEPAATYTEVSTPIETYSPTMSNGPGKPNYSDKPSFTARPTGPPSSYPDNDYSDHGPPWSTTLVIRTTPSWDHGIQSTSATTTPTLIPTGASAAPAPTGDGFPDLQNIGANNSPNRTPMYAAAGVSSVVVIIVGFLVFCCVRKRRRQRQATFGHGQLEEMKQQPKPEVMPYILPYVVPPSPPPAVLPQYTPSSPSSSHPPTASSSQPVILGPIPSGDNGAYLTGMDTSDLVSMTSASNISRRGTVADRDPFADGRSLEEAPPPYRPSSLPPASLASTSRNSSVRIPARQRTTSRTHLIERSPFDDPDDDNISEVSGTTLRRDTNAMSDVSDLSYQVDPVVGRSPF